MGGAVGVGGPAGGHDGGGGGVVCVGLAVLDVVQRVPGPLAWGHKHVSTSAEVAAGGPATNAAVCAAHLLGSATLVTGLGRSAAAEAVGAELAAYGVRVVDLADDDWPLPVAACLVEESGERTVVSPGALRTSWSLTDEARAAVTGAGVLLLDGHHPAAAAAALAQSAYPGAAPGVGPDARRDFGPGSGAPGVGQAARRRPLTILDAGSAKPHAEEWLPALDVVAGSADYAAAIGTDLAGAVRHVLARGAGAAVMTDGAREILWSDGGHLHRTSPPAVRAVDTLGAGDAFHGALAAALSVGRSLGEAVDLAAHIASARVARAGARGWLAAVPRGGLHPGPGDGDPWKPLSP